MESKTNKKIIFVNWMFLSSFGGGENFDYNLAKSLKNEGENVCFLTTKPIFHEPFYFNNINFIDSDPIQIPHLFNKKEDIEISGFLTSVISWGNRKTIIKNGKILMGLLENSPYEFVLNYTENDLIKLNGSIFF